jgi:hypothetical protein
MPQRRLISRAPLVAACTVVLVGSIAAIEGVAQQPGPTPGATGPLAERLASISVELTLHQRVVATDGSVRRQSVAPLKYRWERRRAGAGWRTAITLLSGLRPVVGEGDARVRLDNPFAIVRVEDDEDGTPPRLFDAVGRRVPLPFDAARRQLQAPRVPELPALALPPVTGRAAAPLRPPDPDWLDSFAAAQSARADRQARLARRFGSSAGRVRSLDRFIASANGTTVELLVDPQLVLPVETNILRNGVLISRTTSVYERDGDLIVRRAARAERPLPGANGDRTVVDVEFSNVRLETRGGVR